MRTAWFIGMGLTIALGFDGNASNPDYPIRPVPFTSVRVADVFWTPRMETNRTVTIPFDFKKCEETGRIDNFAVAGGLMKGEFRGIRYDDSDVYKIVEGASYSLALHPDAALDGYLDDLIVKIAAAQEPDGYLYTARTIDPNKLPRGAGPTRWSQLKDSHELYNVGHLYEAAVAHFLATGKRMLLDVAVKNADLIARTFGPGGLHGVPGHEEIEIGLVKLYRATGLKKYLDLAKFFLDERGNPKGHDLYGIYAQDHLPVIRQDKPVGHAVRAGYLYSGMADVAALTGDSSYVKALDLLWTNILSTKLYLTGGIGARRQAEAFGEDYELPNPTAYNETCAAIANALWNERMFLLHGDAQYIDVLERILYNGFLSGVSIEGDRFFYANPLESDGSTPFNMGKPERQPWFNTSCCPSNVARLVPSLPGYVYAQKDSLIYVNLFVAGQATLGVAGRRIFLRQDTRYPWEGKIRITVQTADKIPFVLMIRVPGWALEKPVPSDLYRFAEPGTKPVLLKINGTKVPVRIERGYAVVQKSWKNGDRVELDLPMPIRRVICNENVKTNNGLVALQRGPVVYCAEGTDNGGTVLDFSLDDKARLTAEFKQDLLGGIQIIHGEATKWTPEGKSVRSLTVIPYYAWAHRGAGPMRVWFPRTEEALLRLNRQSVPP